MSPAARLQALLGRRRLLRRLTLLWAMALITWTVHYTFVHAPRIPADTAAALASVIALLSVVIGFYQHHRSKDDRADEHKP